MFVPFSFNCGRASVNIFAVHKEEQRVKNVSLFSLMLVTPMLVACGGGSSGPSANPSANTPEIPTNPFANDGKLTQAIKLYSGNAERQSQSEFFLDPDEGRYRLEIGDGAYQAGDFDPKTGIITLRECVSSQTYTCPPIVGQAFNFYTYMENFSGGDYVLVGYDPSYGTDYMATNPTHDDKIPTTGIVSFVGDTLVFVDNWLIEDEYTGQGTATTTVNFDNGTIDTELTDFDGDFAGASARLSGANIQGAEFKGGVFSTQGFQGITSDPVETHVYGHFYGPNAEELGASVEQNGRDYYANFAWYGAQE